MTHDDEAVARARTWCNDVRGTRVSKINGMLYLAVEIGGKIAVMSRGLIR